MEGKGGKSAKIAAPAEGLAVLQHRAGDVEVAVGDTRLAPLEGEWMTIDLPWLVRHRI